jgi:hypothetical protein
MHSGQRPIFRSSVLRAGRLSVVLAVSAAMLTMGCVSSRKSEFERHLLSTVPQGPSASRDVALAFGLDEFSSAPLASGALMADDF